MADTVYNVRTVYEVDDRAAASKVSGLSRLFGGLWGAIRSTIGSIFSLRGILGGALGVGGILAAGRAVMSLGGEAESTRIAIAGMMQAGGAASNINEALGMSERTLERMRVQARDLPGELRDVMNVFRGGLGGGLAAGQSVNHIREVAGQLMAVTQVLGVDSEQAGRDFAMMLEGRAGAQVATFSRLRAQIGMSAEAFNQLAPAERFRRIEQSMRGFGPAIDRYQSSWAAVSSTTRDHLTTLARSASAPLFERMRDTLARVNHWFEQNQDRVQALARTIGTNLAAAFDRVVGIAQRLAQTISGMSFGDLRELAGRGGAGLLAARAGAGLLGGGGIGLGAGLGVFGLILLPIFAALRTGAIDVSGTMTRLANAARPAIAGLGNLYTALEPAIAAIGVTLVSALSTLAEVIGPVIGGLSSLASGIIGFIGRIPGWLGLRPGEEGPGRNPVRELGELVNGQFDWSSQASQLWGMSSRQMRVSAALGGTRPQLEGVGDFQQSMERARRFLGTESIPGFQGVADVARDVLNNTTASRGVSGQVADMFSALAQARGAARDPIEAALARSGAATNATAGRGNVQVHVRVEQTIENANDPDRVLIATRQGVLDALMHPLESSGLTVTSALQ